MTRRNPYTRVNSVLDHIDGFVATCIGFTILLTAFGVVVHLVFDEPWWVILLFPALPYALMAVILSPVWITDAIRWWLDYMADRWNRKHRNP